MRTTRTTTTRGSEGEDDEDDKDDVGEQNMRNTGAWELWLSTNTRDAGSDSLSVPARLFAKQPFCKLFLNDGSKLSALCDFIAGKF